MTRNTLLWGVVFAIAVISVTAVRIANTSADPAFAMINAVPLEKLCLSEDERERGLCVGYVVSIMDIKYGHPTLAVAEALEGQCGSSSAFEQGRCAGYIEAALSTRDIKHRVPTGDLCLAEESNARAWCSGYLHGIGVLQQAAVASPEVSCFSSSLLSLRNAGLHGWSEVEQLLHWWGEQAQVGEYNGERDAGNVQKFVNDVEGTTELLEGIRTGNLHWLWKACLWRKS